MSLVYAVKGTVRYKEASTLLIELQNITIRVWCDSESIERSSIGQQVELFTHLELNQSEVVLYGFSRKEKLHIFEKILKVSKIGPKTALKIVGSVEPEEFVHLIINKDVERLGQLPGIGKKTAERLIAELKDEQFEVDSEYSTQLFDAIEALVALGFGRTESSEAARSVFKNSMSTEQIVKEALRKLTKRK
ncbi:Holliday junction branch migration protein RuvA [Pseudothermotoga sp. U03pept]|uniref:Holliday junction branch migration protein RuvA n=1 Tax=Pseudothermotoga sp. U03pept TaxID=3447012 RepID=UPI003F071F63